MTKSDIFAPRAIRSPSLVDRILGKLPKANALPAVRDLLLQAADIRDVSPEAIEGIGVAHGVSLHSEFPSERMEFYREFLTYCMQDNQVDADEQDCLAHLGRVLFLSQAQIDRVHELVLGGAFIKEIEAHIGRGEEDGAEFLSKLARRLGLTKEMASRIGSPVLSKELHRRMEELVEDQQLSPEEESQLQTFADSYGVSLRFDEKSKQALARYRYYWCVENAPVLPTLDVEISLQRGEVCHFKTGCSWYEDRVIRRRVNYSGPTVRLKIIRGVYWTAGSVNVTSIPLEQLVLIDQGDLYLTNKRLIFMGAKRNTNLSYRRVLATTPVSVNGAVGIEIDKDAGKSPVVVANCDLQALLMVLSRLRSEAS